MVIPTNATEDLAFDGPLAADRQNYVCSHSQDQVTCHGSITDHDGDGDLVITSFKCCTGAREHHIRFEKMEFAGLRQYVEKDSRRPGGPCFFNWHRLRPASLMVVNGGGSWHAILMGTGQWRLNCNWTGFE